MPSESDDRVTEYDKLVRDRIPERIESAGERPVTHVADDDEYADRLAAKLTEEAEEFEESRQFEELADVLEVVHAILDARGTSLSELEDRRHRKRSDRGGFEERLVLERVEPTEAAEKTE
ncbi:nucleoside triphosphate pyrophosphohydrolase [Halopiger djelfimassiliensis]|uniref:nucleoside triphosphate pyrophosphohydrolase n=1 Tax=Halopiger djelfimassiliensis TaxID=1293047 RepID=UPI000677A9F5|nr:nucleoside triphosphate pyrophosphohydrolase [Halopiger djelfimassiliensis]